MAFPTAGVCDCRSLHHGDQEADDMGQNQVGDLTLLVHSQGPPFPSPSPLKTAKPLR